MRIVNQIKAFAAIFCLMASPWALAQTAYPKDVQALIQRAEECTKAIESFSNEPTRGDQGSLDPDDLDKNGLDQGIGHYCRDLDKQIVEAKDKYQHNADVIQKMAQYDDLFYTVHWLQVNALM